jgi:hypothetical protein
MKLIIETASNGWLIRKEPDEFDDRSELHVFSHCDSFNDIEEVNAFATMLHTLSDLIGPTTSRYSPARVYIEVKPGDKHEDFEDEKSLTE